MPLSIDCSIDPSRNPKQVYKGDILEQTSKLAQDYKEVCELLEDPKEEFQTQLLELQQGQGPNKSRDIERDFGYIRSIFEEIKHEIGTYYWDFKGWLLDKTVYDEEKQFRVRRDFIKCLIKHRGYAKIVNELMIPNNQPYKSYDGRTYWNGLLTDDIHQKLFKYSIEDLAQQDAMDFYANSMVGRIVWLLNISTGYFDNQFVDGPLIILDGNGKPDSKIRFDFVGHPNHLSGHIPNYQVLKALLHRHAPVIDKLDSGFEALIWLCKRITLMSNRNTDTWWFGFQPCEAFKSKLNCNTGFSIKNKEYFILRLLKEDPNPLTSLEDDYCHYESSAVGKSLLDVWMLGACWHIRLNRILFNDYAFQDEHDEMGYKDSLFNQPNLHSSEPSLLDSNIQVEPILDGYFWPQMYDLVTQKDIDGGRKYSEREVLSYAMQKFLQYFLSLTQNSEYRSRFQKALNNAQQESKRRQDDSISAYIQYLNEVLEIFDSPDWQARIQSLVDKMTDNHYVFHTKAMSRLQELECFDKIFLVDLCYAQSLPLKLIEDLENSLVEKPNIIDHKEILFPSVKLLVQNISGIKVDSRLNAFNPAFKKVGMTLYLQAACYELNELAPIAWGHDLCFVANSLFDSDEQTSSFDSASRMWQLFLSRYYKTLVEKAFKQKLTSWHPQMMGYMMGSLATAIIYAYHHNPLLQLNDTEYNQFLMWLKQPFFWYDTLTCDNKNKQPDVYETSYQLFDKLKQALQPCKQDTEEQSITASSAVYALNYFQPAWVTLFESKLMALVDPDQSLFFKKPNSLETWHAFLYSYYANQIENNELKSDVMAQMMAPIAFALFQMRDKTSTCGDLRAQQSSSKAVLGMDASHKACMFEWLMRPYRWHDINTGTGCLTQATNAEGDEYKRLSKLYQPYFNLLDSLRVFFRQYLEDETNSTIAFRALIALAEFQPANIEDPVFFDEIEPYTQVCITSGYKLDVNHVMEYNEKTYTNNRQLINARTNQAFFDYDAQHILAAWRRIPKQDRAKLPSKLKNTYDKNSPYRQYGDYVYPLADRSNDNEDLREDSPARNPHRPNTAGSSSSG